MPQSVVLFSSLMAHIGRRNSSEHLPHRESAVLTGIGLTSQNSALINGNIFLSKTAERISKDEWKVTVKATIGEVPVEEGFNAWLSSFSAMGGDRITEEVNEWYAAQKAAE